jgi:hypothetical protein
MVPFCRVRYPRAVVVGVCTLHKYAERKLCDKTLHTRNLMSTGTVSVYE